MSDAERCPRCRQPNHCAQAGREQAVNDCWCFHTAIPRQLLEELPADAHGQRCLCPNCARALGAPAQPR